ncbi:MAG: 3-deoxy-manno-octulosonate cytidylyltransferase [Bacteroidia bacterium]|nr:3-deoxy-manno-octulosonate cytidylyltransferase [Bacteroidia bacterium]
MKKIVGIIPARYASSRFPGKPLIDIGGKSMIQRVYEQCLKTSILNHVVVATDDERIARKVNEFGGNVVLTASHHQSGTDRCAEALSKLNNTYDVVINIQGDEPFINPKQIELLAEAFLNPHTEIASLIKEITAEEEINNPNVVKAIFNKLDEAIYFSRSPIPYKRNKDFPTHYYKHIGIYAYRADVLPKLTQLKMGTLEQIESLEQLRWIENRLVIRLCKTDLETIAVDTPEDLERILKTL